MNPLALDQDLRIHGRHSAVTTSFVVLDEGAAGVANAGGEGIEAVSSDATKDIAAGTGAREYTLVYVEGTTGLIKSLKWASDAADGTVASAPAGNVTNIERPLDFFCSNFGSDGVNAGDITLQKVSAGGTRLIIKAGRVRCAPGKFRVPTGFSFVYYGARVSGEALSSGTPLSMTAVVEATFNPATAKVAAGIYIPFGSEVGPPFSRTLEITPTHGPIVFPEGTDIRIKAKVNAGTIAVSASIAGRLVRSANIDPSGNTDPAT